MTRPSLLSVLSILLLSGICIFAILIFSIFVVIPSKANQAYGPPTPSLDPLQRFYLSTMLILDEQEITTPTDPQSPPRQFQVIQGEPASAISQRLHSEGFIWNNEAFMHFLEYSGLDRSLQAGDYTLSPAMTSIEIAHALQDSTPSQVDFTILPGWRIEEVAVALPTSGLEISPDEFLSLVGKPAASAEFIENFPPGASLEGFLFPDTYQMDRDLPLTQFIETLLNNFGENLTPNLQEGFIRQGLDVYQAVTLASIVQREAISKEEMPMIASVFFNRLRVSMKLDSDPTVQYALGYNHQKNTWWTNPLSLDDLEINSSYNTYLYPGLPPGPIANPGLQALKAVAFPAETPYFFFRAACDNSGTHVFAITFEEHINNACP